MGRDALKSKRCFVLKKDKAGRNFSHQPDEGVGVHILRDYCL